MSITFVIQNPNSYDLLNPYNILFFRKQLYFITSVDYINDKTLYCQITAERDLFWAYYGNVCSSKGTALITASQLGQDHSKHVDDWNRQDADLCWACDACYSYCGDLRIKKAKKGGLSNDQEIGWQPSWSLVYTDPISALAGGTTITVEGGIKIPDGIVLKKWDSSLEITNPFYNSPKLVFLLDEAHCDDSTLQIISSFYTKEFLNQEYILPNIYNQQTHLLNHSSTQFYFQKKLLMTANLKHVKVRRKNGQFYLIYNIRIRSSIAGVLYYFESGEIFFKWELKVRGQVCNNKLLGMINNALFGAISGVAGRFAKKAGKMLGKGISAVPIPGASLLGALVEGVTEGAADEAEAYQKELANKKIPKIKEMFNSIGLKIIDDKDNPEQEAQTERLKKSTAKTQAKVVEPSIFYSSTIDFAYDLWEFANRSISNPFEARFEHSDLLLSNLYNNNNASPLHNISCRFSQFKQLIKTGYFQAEVNLFYDYYGFWKEICGKGTQFYQDIENEFKPWKPVFRLTQSSQFKAISNIEVSVGEEEIEEIDIREKVANAKVDKKEWGHGTFIRPTNASQMPEFLKLGTPFSHPNSKQGFCWGCSGNPTTVGNESVFNPTQDTDIEFYLDKDSKSNRQVASCKAGNSYKVEIIQSGNDLDIYFNTKGINIRYKEEKVEIDREEDYTREEWKEEPIIDDNTQYHSNIGEAEREGFEGEKPETETEKQEFDKPETELKEKSGEREKDIEKENEKEREKEKELQKERELEREKELQREKEKQAEAEKSKENKEKQAEKDKKEVQRKEREAKARERQLQREKTEKEKTQKDKEKKERE